MMALKEKVLYLWKLRVRVKLTEVLSILILPS